MDDESIIGEFFEDFGFKSFMMKADTGFKFYECFITAEKRLPDKIIRAAVATGVPQ
jgi:hypothetical protein